mmetsp:Transcript_28061/g.59242  ORF Transcript_28061/g.59242 Transcript_28061/m.59242 type:complete len:486 (-) Transcript_28061:52-1509(-)
MRQLTGDSRSISSRLCCFTQKQKDTWRRSSTSGMSGKMSHLYLQSRTVKMLHGIYAMIGIVFLALGQINIYLFSKLTFEKGGIPGQREYKGPTAVLSPRYVICTRVRNEAPYLREWIEYHRMIGFDTFLILNDKSTDDTQCILNAYAKENIVRRIPFDVEDSYSGKLWHIFDDCANYLNSHPDQFNPSKTWMMTHDIDEFVYIKNTENSIHNAVMRLSNPNQVMSLKVPRLTFGSSGREHYQPRLVIDRFTRRFNHTICPEWREKYRNKGSVENKGGRGLSCNFNRLPTNSYENVKSISLVSNMAEECYQIDKDTGEVLPEGTCADTHLHTLVDVTEHRGVNNSTHRAKGNRGKKERENDPRYADPITVGDDIVIMHYWVKSRQEFYERVHNSIWNDKYFECPECTPETFFNLTGTYANSFKDSRMARNSPKLKQRLAELSIGVYCKAQANLQSIDYYRHRFDRIGAELRDGTRKRKHVKKSKEK